MRKALLIVLIVFAGDLVVQAQGWKADIRYANFRNRISESSVLIEAKVGEAKLIGTGTMFKLNNPRNFPFGTVGVLTVRHLVDGADAVRISFVGRSADEPSMQKKFSFSYTKGDILVEHHPDSNVDLCLIIIDNDLKVSRMRGKEILYLAMEMSVLADEKFYLSQLPLDPVVMVGYPKGFLDEFNLQPIFRRGVYATRPSLNYKGKKEFLLDIQNNGGSNGSAVYRFDDGMYNDRSNGGVNIVLADRLVLVGISYDGVDMTKNKEYREVFGGTPASIVNVIKADRIRELCDYVIRKLSEKGNIR